MKRLLLLSMAAMTVATQGCVRIPPFGPTNDRGDLQLEVVRPAEGLFTGAEVLLLPLSGLVSVGDMTTDVRTGPGMLVEVQDRLQAARENPSIRAVVMRIDSPGGTVTASDLIYREIKHFKEETGLPVVALMTGAAASGALYLAMAADEVYALPTTITGSIGVIALYPNLTELGDKIGVRVNAVKSGAFKDAGSPWRDMSEEDRELFQDLIDSYHQRFRGVILQARADHGMEVETLDAIADGRIMNADQALAANLIDGIKYPDEVFERAMALAGIDDAAVVSYEYPFHYRGNIYAAAPPAPPQMELSTPPLWPFDLAGLARQMSGAHFLYLWLP